MVLMVPQNRLVERMISSPSFKVVLVGHHLYMVYRSVYLY